MNIYKRVSLLRRQQFLGFMNSSKKIYYAWNKNMIEQEKINTLKVVDFNTLFSIIS